MKFLLYLSELSLLKDLEFGVVDSESYNPVTHELKLCATEYRRLVIDIFDVLPLLNDKNEQWILSNLGVRIMQRVI